MYRGQNFKLEKEFVRFVPRLIWAWNVLTDGDYECVRSEEDRLFYPTKTLVLIRIIKGTMNVETKENRATIGEGEMVVLPLRDIVKYNSKSKILNYHWYNFISDSLPIIKLNKVYSLPICEDECRLFNEMNEYSDKPFAFGEYIANLKFTEQISSYIMRLSENEATVDNGISSLIDTIRVEYGRDISLASVANKHAISERSLRNHFYKYVGMSPKQYQFKIRMQKGTEYLNSTELTINEISEKLGYTVSVHFSRDFKNYYGFSPTSYRSKVK